MNRQELGMTFEQRTRWIAEALERSMHDVSEIIGKGRLTIGELEVDVMAKGREVISNARQVEQARKAGEREARIIAVRERLQSLGVQADSLAPGATEQDIDRLILQLGKALDKAAGELEAKIGRAMLAMVEWAPAAPWRRLFPRGASVERKEGLLIFRSTVAHCPPGIADIFRSSSESTVTVTISEREFLGLADPGGHLVEMLNAGVADLNRGHGRG